MVSVLGISLGTRTLGLAIFSDGTLIHWQVKSFKGVWSERKLKNILTMVTAVLDKYGVNLTICKVVPPSYSSELLDAVVNGIAEVCVKKGVGFSTCYLEDIMEVVLPSGTKVSKAILADMLALKHPELALEFSRERINRHPYYIKLFEAIAAWEFYQRKRFDDDSKT